MPKSFVSATNEHKGQWDIEKSNGVYECPLFILIQPQYECVKKLFSRTPSIKFCDNLLSVSEGELCGKQRDMLKLTPFQCKHAKIIHML